METKQLSMREVLDSYQANKRLIERNRKKIEDELGKETTVLFGNVKGSSKEFPYRECRFPVLMNDPEEEEHRNKKIAKLKLEIEIAKKDMEEAEERIEALEEIKVREIFTYRFIDNMKISEIASIVGYSNGRVSQLITKHLND